MAHLEDVNTWLVNSAANSATSVDPVKAAFISWYSSLWLASASCPKLSDYSQQAMRQVQA